MKIQQQFSRFVTVALFGAVILSGCGGGGGGSGGGNSGNGGTGSSGKGVTINGVSTTDLSFSTKNQGLFNWGGDTVKTEKLDFKVLNQQIGPKQQGMIKNTKVPLSLETTQAIWQKAMDTCTSYTYHATYAGVTYNVTPTTSECKTGKISRCIVNTAFGCAYTYKKDLGGGIGDKPTSGTSKAYDLGMALTSSSDLRMGFVGSLTRDLGSVDVDFSTTATASLDKTAASAGDLVTLSTSHLPGKPYMMTSRYPSVEIALDMYAYFTANMSIEYAGVNPKTGDQVHTTTNLLNIDSRKNSKTDNGNYFLSNGKQEVFRAKYDFGGNGFSLNLMGVDIADSGLNSYSYELTYPENPPEPPAKDAPKFKWPVSFSLAEFSFTMPKLNTPAAEGFQCGMCEPPLRSFDDGSGTITSTTPLGPRTLIGGITDGNGWTLPLVNDGVEDVDLFRIDLDADAPTLAAGVPLGAIFSDPSGLDLLTADLNALDLDIANFFSVDQRLNFDPNLMVELQFSVPTAVRGPQDSQFNTVSSIRIHVGDSIQFYQPDAKLVITPVYTLRDNKFVNDTRLMVNTAIQETLIGAKLGGKIADSAASLLGMDLNFALLQLTPELYKPQVVTGSDTTPWSLGGFKDVTGSKLTVKLAQ